MKFRTKVEITQLKEKIYPDDKILLLGSCFAEHVGGMMRDSGMDVQVNPFGVLYNPRSIVRCLELMAGAAEVCDDWFFENDGCWYSWMNDSSVYGDTRHECANRLKAICEEQGGRLSGLDVLFITLGTPRYYEHTGNGWTVGNCHKQPHQMFSEKEMSAEAIVALFDSVLQQLWLVRPDLNVVFTVSPYRYAKYGFHENQIGKAKLLLAVDELQHRYRKCMYFPAYEILLDELRDYRFYAEDMLHPSEMAVAYIWERFSEAWLHEKTLEFIHRYQEIHRAVQHRPLRTDSERHRHFLLSTFEKAERMAAVYPHIKDTRDYKILYEKLIGQKV